MKCHNCLLLLRAALGLLAAGAMTASAQTLPGVQGTVITGMVTASSDILTFQYTIANPVSSTGSIALVGLDVTQPPAALTLATNDLPPVANGFAPAISAALPNIGQTVQAVGTVASAPSGWMVVPTTDARILWGAVSMLIGPGQTLSGFQVISHGLPGIRTFTAEPEIDIGSLNVTPPSGDPADFQRYKADLQAVEAPSTTTGITVGPTAPPARFNAQSFLTVIQGFEGPAVQQGWIKNSGILNSLDQKLSAAAAALQRGDNNTAENVLGALINEVDAQAGKGLSSEAVALFKYNAQYLIAQLP